MKKLLTVVISVLTITVFGQIFNSKIVYKNTYVSKIPNVTSDQFTLMMGSVQTYFIQNGNYKSITNGSLNES